MKVVYNTVVSSNEVEVLNNVVKRCPYECVELGEGRYGFMDNESGDVRNYFCDTLGYECSNNEAFDFEYFDETQKFFPVIEDEPTPSGEKSESIPSPVKNSKVYTREAYGMMVTAYFVDEDKFIKKGEYKETMLDQQKKEADILLKSIDGNWYTIYSNIEIELKSKRIRRYDNGCIAVPESIYNKLKAKYNVMCDF